MAAYRPLIAIDKTTADEPSLIAIFTKTGSDAHWELNAAGIELTTHEVETYEVTVELLAEPVACLRLKKPVANLLVVAERPRVETESVAHRPTAVIITISVRQNWPLT